MTICENVKNNEYSQRCFIYGGDISAPKGRGHATSSKLSLSSKVSSATASRFAFVVLSPETLNYVFKLVEEVKNTLNLHH